MEEQKKRRTSQGKCRFCGGTFGKGGMSRHLESCKERKVSTTPAGRGKLRKARLLHIVAEGQYANEYWLHLEVPADATLRDLDDFLRRIWLECCGHLSAFRIGGQSYSSYPDRSWGDRSMSIRLGEVMMPGMKCHHEYDFGSTTYLTLKAVSEREGEVKGKSIRILSRNDPPFIPCFNCGKMAAQVCMECIWDDKGWLCEECAEDHECGDEMFLPVVNSPRVGECGYAGEMDDDTWPDTG